MMIVTSGMLKSPPCIKKAHLRMHSKFALTMIITLKDNKHHTKGKISEVRQTDEQNDEKITEKEQHPPVTQEEMAEKNGQK